MQFTAVWIKNYIAKSMPLYDICVYIPVWFGVIATFVTGMIAYEASLPVNSSKTAVDFMFDLINGTKSPPKGLANAGWAPTSPALECAVFTMAMMSILPAHLMRSMGGGYDNESVAMTAMVSTFYFWMRSLRANDSRSHWFGIITAVAYFNMVASWGGYVFVLNMIGVHAAALIFSGRFDYKVYMAYTLFYSIGTFLAMQVPVVGWTPLKSLEQLGPFAIFGLYQVLFVADRMAASKNLNQFQKNLFRVKLVCASAAVALALALVLAPSGYFGPISSRVRGLFVKHTKTGNPLVDSVAEHQQVRLTSPSGNRNHTYLVLTLLFSCYRHRQVNSSIMSQGNLSFLSCFLFHSTESCVLSVSTSRLYVCTHRLSFRCICWIVRC
jgi:dolichyl-diphosphooligosaccharide--protein glycosyltransferase